MNNTCRLVSPLRTGLPIARILPAPTPIPAFWLTYFTMNPLVALILSDCHQFQ